MAGSTRRAGAAARWASRARRQPSDAVSRIFSGSAGPVGSASGSAAAAGPAVPSAAGGRTCRMRRFAPVPWCWLSRSTSARSSAASCRMRARLGRRPSGRVELHRLDVPVELRCGRGGEEAVELGSTEVRLLNCPFHPLAVRSPELVCSINHAFLGGFLTGLQAAGIDAALAPHPGRCWWSCAPRPAVRARPALPLGGVCRRSAPGPRRIRAQRRRHTISRHPVGGPDAVPSGVCLSAPRPATSAVRPPGLPAATPPPGPVRRPTAARSCRRPARVRTGAPGWHRLPRAGRER